MHLVIEQANLSCQPGPTMVINFSLLHALNYICLITIVLSVEFDQMSYAGSESSGVITVTLSLSGGTSTNDITVTVISSGQSPVSAEGKESMSCTY